MPEALSSGNSLALGQLVVLPIDFSVDRRINHSLDYSPLSVFYSLPCRIVCPVDKATTLEKVGEKGRSAIYEDAVAFR
jgi:hypothetical protein